MTENAAPSNWKERLRLFFKFNDSRFEDLVSAPDRRRVILKDLSAGLVVAMTAIPMAMGFAMAMGLRPEQGIIAGALACLVGRTFGGSKYQVYGPTAAFIPLIAALIHKYGTASGGSAEAAHGFLVLVSILSGLVLMLLGLLGIGRFAKLVPNSIVVGFTVGIAVSIALTNAEDVLGIEKISDLLGQDEDIHGGLWHNLMACFSNLHKINEASVFLGLFTLFATRKLMKVSPLIPGPVVAIGGATLMAATVLRDHGIILVRDIYGKIPTNFFQFTPPHLPSLSDTVVIDILYFVTAIVFVSGVESLLCSSMADRLANNQGTKFNPDKEFFGQGLVQIITPLVNGFPCTGALARTATSIKAGAVTPLAGYFKAILKLMLAYFFATYLEMIPMACIGGILLWVASNMIKPSEVREVMSCGRFESLMMVYTAVMVPLTDFLTGVLSALILYFVARKLFPNFTTSTPADHEFEPTA